NGIGYKTPPMGWNPYNAFHSNFNDVLIKQHADIIASEGYLEVGYRYINLDDGWQAPIRIDKKLYHNLFKFPLGMKDAGTQTCGGQPGSLDNEDIDAQTFVEWDVDYLKYDNCNDQGRPEQQRYQAMANALKSATTGKNKTIFYNMCEWGTSNPWLWGPDSQVRLTEYGGPGGWNDPDMLVVGFDGIPFDEQITHYAFWSALKAPLILGCDLTKVNNMSKALILNKDIISVNQDPLGLSICQVYYKTDNKISFDIWTGPLIDGYVAILFNRGIDPINITLDFKNHCHLTGTIEVYDLVKQQSSGYYTNSYTAIDIPKHGVEFVKLIGGNITDTKRPCLNNS
ncbi:4170_t:CDS:10, partial [Dentiscutata heterogama]